MRYILAQIKCRDLLPMKKKKSIILLLVILCLIIAAYSFSGRILSSIGKYLTLERKPEVADAVVVLNTGMEYYPRLIEAANLYKKGFVKKIIINGNRKTDVLRRLEAKGFKGCCPWYESRLRVLELYDVARNDVLSISAEDAYDTVTEAEAVGKEIINIEMKKILLTTSKSHTRRAFFIWTKMYEKDLLIIPVSADSDPFDPNSWWKDGRQIRWVLAEYGAWIYYYWKRFKAM